MFPLFLRNKLRNPTLHEKMMMMTSMQGKGFPREGRRKTHLPFRCGGGGLGPDLLSGALIGRIVLKAEPKAVGFIGHLQQNGVMKALGNHIRPWKDLIQVADPHLEKESAGSLTPPPQQQQPRLLKGFPKLLHHQQDTLAAVVRALHHALVLPPAAPSCFCSISG